MSFNTNKGRQSFTASGGQTEFDFNFKIFEVNDIKVYLTPVGSTPDDAANLLTYGSDYSVSIDGDNGGTIVLNNGATLDDDVVVAERVLPRIRDISYVTNGDLKAATLNEDQDYQTYLLVDDFNTADRSLALPSTDVTMSPELPSTVEGGYLRVKADGTGYEYIILDDVSSTSIWLIDTIADLSSIDFTISDTAYVKDIDRGGYFIYDPLHSAVNNGGTIFNGWVRQYEGAILSDWWGKAPDTSAGQEAIITKIFDVVNATNTDTTPFNEVGQHIVLGKGYRINYTNFPKPDEATFSNITNWPENCTIEFQGSTREQNKLMNHFSKAYEVVPGYTARVPVNEQVIKAPYHPGLVLTNLTKDAYGGVEQEAQELGRLLGENGGADTSRYKSIIFNQNDDLHWQIVSNGIYNDLTFNKTKVVNEVASDWQPNRLRSFGNWGDWGIQRGNPEYPLDVAGAMRVIADSTNESDNQARFATPKLILETPTGQHYMEGVASQNTLKIQAMLNGTSASRLELGVAGADGSTQQGVEIYPTRVRPLSDNIMALGLGSFRWTTLYAATGTINTSDDREKTYLSITDTERAVALELKANMKKFKMNESIETKGEDKARIHFGASAQTVKSIFEAHGLVAEEYAILCYDEWDAEYDQVIDIPEKVADNGDILQEATYKNGALIKEAGNRYGLRYEELLSFIIASI